LELQKRSLKTQTKNTDAYQDRDIRSVSCSVWKQCPGRGQGNDKDSQEAEKLGRNGEDRFMSFELISQFLLNIQSSRKLFLLFRDENLKRFTSG